VLCEVSQALMYVQPSHAVVSVVISRGVHHGKRSCALPTKRKVFHMAGETDEVCSKGDCEEHCLPLSLMCLLCGHDNGGVFYRPRPDLHPAHNILRVRHSSVFNARWAGCCCARCFTVAMRAPMQCAPLFSLSAYTCGAGVPVMMLKFTIAA
jgi:hypothetical protein